MMENQQSDQMINTQEEFDSLLDQQSLLEKVKAYSALKEKIEALETQKKALVAEILQLMPKKTKSLPVPGYIVKRAMRLSIKTSLESAKLLGAVKMEEVIDKEKIKGLYALGHPVSDVSEIHFIQVYAAPEKSES